MKVLHIMTILIVLGSVEAKQTQEGYCYKRKSQQPSQILGLIVQRGLIKRPLFFVNNLEAG